MIHMTCCTGSAEGSRAYYCGWAITGLGTVSHLVSAPSFPAVGSRHRSWCGQMITVIGLALSPRGLAVSCRECNRYLRVLADPPG
jgi:hypothetical protein